MHAPDPAARQHYACSLLCFDTFFFNSFQSLISARQCRHACVLAAVHLTPHLDDQKLQFLYKKKIGNDVDGIYFRQATALNWARDGEAIF